MLFEESYEALLTYARRRVGEDADDVVAETLTVAWRRLDDVPADAVPWLGSKVRNRRRRGERAVAEGILDSGVSIAEIPR